MIRRALVVVGAVGLVLCGSPAGGQVAPAELRLALVLPIRGAPLFTPTGEPEDDADDRLAATAEVLAALADPELEEIPLSLAVSPLYCDEVRHVGGGAAGRVLTRLRELSSRFPVLTGPYADIRLTDVEAPSMLKRELVDGRNVLSSCLRAQPGNVAYPPDLEIERAALAAIEAVGVKGVLAPAEEIRVQPAQVDGVTLVPTKTILSQDDPNDAFVRLAGWDAAAATVPVERSDLRTFIRAVADDPRISLVTLAELVADPPTRTVTLPSAADPPPSFFRAISRAAGALADFRSYTLPNNRLAGILRTALARSRSTAEWNARWAAGRRRAQAIVETVEGQQRLVAGAEGSVTFTSRRGSVPVTVTNGSTYPVRVRVRLASSKLVLTDGSTRTVTVEPPGEQIVFKGSARSTGAFPVQVQVTSPNGAIRFDAGEITVRSTAANIPALVLTIGGALFLLVWSARKLSARRKANADE